MSIRLDLIGCRVRTWKTIDEITVIDLDAYNQQNRVIKALQRRDFPSQFHQGAVQMNSRANGNVVSVLVFNGVTDEQINELRQQIRQNAPNKYGERRNNR